MSTRRQKTIDLVLGMALGGLIGAIVAVNLIITVGIGYDVSLPQVFRENLLVGIITTVILISGPVAGVALMRRLRRQRERDDSTRSLMR
jgi:NhaP-type Na+/H+ or K+/H+ antiporter